MQAVATKVLSCLKGTCQSSFLCKHQSTHIYVCLFTLRKAVSLLRNAASQYPIFVASISAYVSNHCIISSFTCTLAIPMLVQKSSQTRSVFEKCHRNDLVASP